MTSDIINLRLEKGFLKEIDLIAKQLNFHSRTELIRHSLRETIEREKLKQAVLKLRGSIKTKTTDEDLEKIREKVFMDEYSKFR